MSLLLRHRLPLLLVAFLFAPSGGDDSYDSMCLQPRRCGDVRIEYPFYLLGNDDSYCGYPGLGIQCKDGNHAVLQLGDGNYAVSDINYMNFTISLVHQEVLENLGCPRVDHNVTFGSSWLSFPDNMVDYYLLFFRDCSFGPGLVRPAHISCNSFDGQTYVWPGNKAPPQELVEACHRVIQVPVLELPDDVPWNDSQRINGGYGEVLVRGFQLEWDRGKPPAWKQCEDSHGKCRYNQVRELVGCLSADGRDGAQKCTAYSSSGKPFEA